MILVSRILIQTPLDTAIHTHTIHCPWKFLPGRRAAVLLIFMHCFDCFVWLIKSSPVPWRLPPFHSFLLGVLLQLSWSFQIKKKKTVAGLAGKSESFIRPSGWNGWPEWRTPGNRRGNEKERWSNDWNLSCMILVLITSSKINLAYK